MQSLRCLTLAISACLLPNLRAQVREFGYQHFDARASRLLAAVDLNGDGRLDLAAQGPILHEQIGQLRFTDIAGHALPPGVFGTATTFFDVSGDGVVDIVGLSTASLRVAVRAGGLYRDESWRVPAASLAGTLLHGDVDRDGDLDLLVTGSSLAVLRNDGRGVFTLDSGRGPAASGIAAAVDLDGDGAVEVVVGGYDLTLLVNDGSGSFTSRSVPLALLTNAVLHFDYDGDGDIDIAVGGQDANSPLRLLRNDGGLNFSDQSGTLPAVGYTVRDLAALDIDNDGDQDLFIAAEGLVSEILINTPSGYVRSTAPLVPSAVGVRDVVSGDFDGDGRADLVVREVGNANVTLWHNVGGKLAAINPPRIVPGTRHLVDLDNDGDVDSVGLFDRSVVAEGMPVLFTARNDGSGRQLLQQTIRLTDDVLDLYVAELNGDGRKDVIAITGVAQVGPATLRQFLGDGRGNLAVGPTQQVIYRAASGGIAVDDLDGDGDDDLVWPTPAGAFVMQNVRATTGFLPAPLPGSNQLTVQAVAYDLDRDGRADVLTSGRDGIRVFANRGGLTFVEIVGAAPNATQSAPIALGRGAIPGQEVVLFSYPPFGGMQTHSWNGSSFQPLAASSLTVTASSLRTINLDVVGGDRFVLSSRYATRILSTSLVDVTSLVEGAASAEIAAHGDVDLDGDMDVVLDGVPGTGYFDTIPWWLAQGPRKQLSAPFAPSPGNDYRIDYTNQIGSVQSVLLLNTRSVRAVLPFGVLRVDPTGMLAVPLPYGTRSSVQFALPPSRALLGLMLAAQVLSARGTELELSNLVLETIR
ncbi:MAG: VCBS repeat-containing protein [Planctomycetota bacterium]